MAKEPDFNPKDRRVIEKSLTVKLDRIPNRVLIQHFGL